MSSKLGIIAGGGDLPARLIARCKSQGRPFFVVALKNQAAAEPLEGEPVVWFRLGEAGSSIAALRKAEVKDLVMAGPVRRPSLLELRPDARTAAFFAKVGIRAFGDDSLLSAVATELEEAEGFKVVTVESILGEGLAPSGPIAGPHVPQSQLVSIHRGLKVAKALGAQDVGQAVVVQQGVVLGVEAVEGTDALIARAGALQREGEPGVLVKVFKPGQDGRVDRPAIGPSTLKAAADAGLAGLAVEAGEVLIVDLDEVRSLAETHGLFLVGVKAGDGA